MRPIGRPAVTPDRLMTRFDMIVARGRSARISLINVDAYGVMSVTVRLGQQIWTRTMSCNDRWGWDGILREWRSEMDYWDKERQAS